MGQQAQQQKGKLGPPKSESIFLCMYGLIIIWFWMTKRKLYDFGYSGAYKASHVQRKWSACYHCCLTNKYSCIFFDYFIFKNKKMSHPCHQLWSIIIKLECPTRYLNISKIFKKFQINMREKLEIHINCHKNEIKNIHDVDIWCDRHLSEWWNELFL